MSVKRLSIPIFVVFVFVLCTSVSAVCAADCTCGDICVSTTGWWRAGGTFNASETPIQAAVDFAAEGDTVCVKDGTYTENVDVDKRLTIWSENGSDSTIVDAASNTTHVFNVATNYVNFSGFTVTGADYKECAGIYLNYAEHCNISGNEASENNWGISLFSSCSNTITNNYANHNDLGIGLFHSSSNIVSGNNASYNIGLGGIGIVLVNSGNNTLRNNVMSGNHWYNFDAEGESYSELNNDIDLSNLVDGKPIYYLVDASDTVIDSTTNAGTVYCINCDNITVKDLTLEKNFHGIYFYNTSNSRIENNNISSCFFNIDFFSSSNNSITGNDASGGGLGIRLLESCGNTITDNNVCYSLNKPNIYIEDSDYNVITGNNASVGYEGIFLVDSAYNTITNNIASNNYGGGGKGIILEDSSSNTLTNNTMDGNKQNFYIDGEDILHFIQTIDTSNTVDGRPIYYWINQQNQQVPDDAGFVGIVSSRNITVSDTTNYEGILFANVTNSRVENVNASILGTYGIRLFFSSDNTLSNNTVSNNKSYCFFLYNSSNNSISNNTVLNNHYYSFVLDTSSNNMVSNNIVSNSGFGFVLALSSNNMVSNNIVSNSRFGFVLEESSNNNTITNNSASDITTYDFLSDNKSYSNKITDLTISSYPTTISFIYENGIIIKSVIIPEQEDPAGKVNIGKYVDVTNVSADSWILLNVSYNDADVTNVEEASLRLYRSLDMKWVEIPGSGVNTAENYVYANVSSFSQIAAFGIPKTPEATIYVPDNYTTIQAAVDNASAGDTIIVRDGTYTENVNVGKQLTIRSENGSDSTIVDAAYPSESVFNVGVDYVNINGFTVKGAIDTECAGISLNYAEHCNISGNDASENNWGISLFSSNSNTITNNKASENNDFGIALVSSSSNTITNNYASHTNGTGIGLSKNSSSNIVTGNNACYNIGGSGVALANSGNNTLRDNVMSGNRYNFDADGVSYSELDNDVDLSNLVDGKPIYYLVDASDTILDSATNAGTVYCIHCDNVTIKDLTLERNFFGVFFYNTNNSRIENNNISICNIGIALASSSNNSITGNNAGEGSHSIALWESSGNTITDNTVCFNLHENIYLEDSDYNVITSNNASSGEMGISLRGSDYNTITNNIASNNIIGGYGYGISLEDSRHNTLTNNTMDENRQNFYIDGRDISHFIQDIDTSNTVGGRPIYYRVNQQNLQVPDDVGFIGIVSSRNITVSDTTNYDGIVFANVTNSRVENVNASIQGRYGIRLFFSSDNTLSNNTVSNIGFGFFLQDSSNNMVSNNSVSNSGYGFVMDTSSNNMVSNNSVSNSGIGFVLQMGSDSNTIMNNTASDNHDLDFFSRASYSNKITDLTICNLTISSYPTTISFIYEGGIEIMSVTIPDHEDTAGKVNIGKYVNVKDITVDSWILLNVSYNDADVTNVEEASLRLYRSTDTDWTEIPGSGVNTVENYVYANVTNYGQIAAFGDPKTPEVTIYVPDNYTTIQAAVDNASAGGTIIVRDGTYTENVDVDKRLTIRSENGLDSTIVDAADSMEHVFNVSTDYVNISGFTVKGADYEGCAGINLDYAEHCNISDNDASKNGCGIVLLSSISNTITNNKASENDFGIALISSNSNTITHNYASYNDNTGFGFFENSRSNIITGNNASYNNGSGVDLAKSGNNTLRNNVMSDNGRYNFDADGESYSELDNDIDISNFVDEKPIYYLVDASNEVIDSATNAGIVYCVNCDNVTVKDLTLEKNFFGIYFYNTSDSRIENNNIRNCNVGINLKISDYNVLTNNIVSNSYGDGIALVSSSHNTLTNNTMEENGQNFYIDGKDISHFIQTIDTSNTVDGRPIYYWVNQQNQQVPSNAGFVGIVGSRNITVSDTKNYDGILFANVTNSRVENVNASIQGTYGIQMFFSSNNTLSSNTVSNDYIDYSFFLHDSCNNSISNNIVSNSSTGFVLQEGSNSNTITNNTASNNSWLVFYSDCESYSNKIKDLTICSYPTTISFMYEGGIEIKSVKNPEHEDPAGKVNIGKYVNVTDIEEAWILLNVSYNDADVTHVEEASLRLYRSTDTDWVEIPGSGVNTVENYVYANVTDIGQIAAFGASKTPEVTIYVPDNYTTIQAAVDNASAGGTIIVRDGTYTENVDVDKRLTIRSENGSDSTIVGVANSSYNVFKVTADYVTISGFTVTGATEGSDTSGIYLFDADYCDISDNNVSNNWAGIFLHNSSNNTIKNNAVNSNFEMGINLVFSSNCNTITNNIASTNGVGIVLGRFTSSNILMNNIASNNHDGIHLYSSSDNKLTNNNASNNNFGIHLLHSSNNTITGNTALNNTDVDFYSDEGSHDNSIADFTINSYPTTISFIYEHGIWIKAVTAPEPDPAGKVNVSKYVNVTNATEDSWILLNVSYSDADVTNVKEDSLRLYRWTDTDWAEIAGSGVNTAENYVYANVTSFSQIAAFGDPTTPPTPTPAPRRGGGGGGSSGPCDTDGDGYGDIDEIIMGTDPYDPCDPDPTCIACLASIGGKILPKPAVKPQATPRLVSTPEPVRAPTSKPAPTPVPEPEKPGIPGFEAVFAVAGLLAVAYLIRRKKK